jgi:hypothetical protein
MRVTLYLLNDQENKLYTLVQTFPLNDYSCWFSLPHQILLATDIDAFATLAFHLLLHRTCIPFRFHPRHIMHLQSQPIILVVIVAIMLTTPYLVSALAASPFANDGQLTYTVNHNSHINADNKAQQMNIQHL